MNELRSIIAPAQLFDMIKLVQTLPPGDFAEVGEHIAKVGELIDKVCGEGVFGKDVIRFGPRQEQNRTIIMGAFGESGNHFIQRTFMVATKEHKGFG